MSMLMTSTQNYFVGLYVYLMFGGECKLRLFLIYSGTKEN